MAFPSGMWYEAYYFITNVIAVKWKHFFKQKTWYIINLTNVDS